MPNWKNLTSSVSAAIDAASNRARQPNRPASAGKNKLAGLEGADTSMAARGADNLSGGAGDGVYNVDDTRATS